MAFFSLVISQWKSTMRTGRQWLGGLVEQAVHGLERRVELVHEDPAHDVDDRHLGHHRAAHARASPDRGPLSG